MLITMAMVCGHAIAFDPMEAREEGALSRDHIEEWEFREDVHVIPDYPDIKKALPIEIDTASENFNYFIDPDALSIGVDELIRFTIIIKSSSGARNVFHETMRCDTREYKTLAYGTSDNTFYRLVSPQWKPVPAKTASGLDYRKDLLDNYFCDYFDVTLSRREILHRVKYPQQITQDPLVK
jgi:hypothetical protein